MPLLHSPSSLRKGDKLVLLTRPLWLAINNQPNYLRMVMTEFLGLDSEREGVFTGHRYMYIDIQPYYESGCHILKAKNCSGSIRHSEDLSTIMGRVSGKLDLDTYSVLTYLRGVTKQYHRHLWDEFEDFRFGS